MDFDASKAVKNILEQLKKTSWLPFTSLLISIVVIGAYVLWGIICLPIVFNMIIVESGLGTSRSKALHTV